MRINFELLDARSFLTVLDLGSFSKAAERLNMSQPALSRRIQALEATIGAPLLERTTRHVAPTAMGRSFAPLAQRLLAEFDEQLLGLGDFKRTQSGQIIIACVPTAAFYFLPRAIEKFNKAYPNIRFRILDLSANDGLEAVARGEAEFGINFMGISDSQLTFMPLVDDPFVLACRKDHRLAKRKRISWTDLTDEPIIGVSRASGNRILLESALAKLNMSLRFQYEVNHLTTSLGLVEKGLGLSVLPRMATPSNAHSIITTRPLINPIVHRTVGIVARHAARLSPAAERFQAMLMAMK
jgi:DNA-binding transcriptional LysR family regulator